MRTRREELRFNGWGRADKRFDLKGRDAEVWAFVSAALGAADLPDTPACALERVALPPVALGDEALSALGAICEVETDAYERAFHALGKSYYDLLRIRRGEVPSAPDAVVYPRGHDEVMRLLRACAERRIAVVPFGGGSSVVGGVEARRTGEQTGVVTLDTTRMARLLELDEVSRTATFETGIYGPELEERLGEKGYTLGHHPQSFEFSTLGGWIAARGAGQQSNRYGTAAKMLVAARVATPSGEWRTQPYPASAAGPDLNACVAGSEGALGVITEATVRIREAPAARDFFAFLFRDWESGAAAVRRVVQAELPVATLRLSDAEETRFFGAFRHVLEPSRVQEAAQKALGLGGFDRPCVLMVGIEGAAGTVRRARRHALALVTRGGGLYVGRGPGRSWWKNRFEMPYLRDPLMDHGVGVDTLETSTTWSNVSRLYAAVGDAIRGALDRAIVMAHISHSYLDGASLYFTFVFARDRDDEVAQWRRVKEAASAAISAHGGTISHHHGVGIDHARWLVPEKGELGIEILAAAKRALDPQGIMNPGKLLA